MTTEKVYENFSKLSDKDKKFVLDVMDHLLSMNGEGWLPVRQAAIYLGVAPNTLRKMIEEGSIRSKNVAERKTLVSIEDIESIAQERKN